MKEIVKAVAEYYGLWDETIYRRSRKAKIRKARQISIYVIRKKLTATHHKIADHFDMNHSTIVHSIKTVENEILTDNSFQKELLEIMAIVSKITIEDQNRLCNPSKF